MYIVKLLINEKANPTISNNKQMKPIHYCSKKGYYDLFKFLLSFSELTVEDAQELMNSSLGWIK